MRTAVVVLCGGRSSRMGAPKAWLPFGDELMLTRVVRTVREAVGPVVVVAAPGQDVPPLPPDVRVVRDEVEGRGPLGGLAAGLAALKETADAVYLSSCDVPLLKPEFVRRVVGFVRLPLSFPAKPTPPGPPSVDSPALSAEFLAGRGKGRGESGTDSPPPSAVRGGSVSPLPFREGGPGGVGLAFPLATVPLVDDRLHPLAAAYRLAVLPVVREMLAANRFRMTELFDLISTRAIGPEELADVDPELVSLRNVNTPDEYAAAVRESRAPGENA